MAWIQPRVGTPRIKTAVIGADRLMRDILQNCLPAWDSHFDCVLEDEADGHAVRQCRVAGVELIVVDTYGYGAGELAALAALQECRRWALLVIAHNLPEYIVERLMLRERCGVITRNGSLDALVKAAHVVVLGGTYLDAATQQILRQRMVPGAEDELSKRERHVLQLVAEGYSTKEVASMLRLSAKTVDKYRTTVMQKLKTHDVVRLTHHAIRMGLVQV